MRLRVHLTKQHHDTAIIQSKLQYIFPVLHPTPKEKDEKKYEYHEPCFKSSSTSTQSDGSLNILNTTCLGALALARHTLSCSSALFLSPSLILRFLERERSEGEVSGVSAPAPDGDGDWFAVLLLFGVRGWKEDRDCGAGGVGTSSALNVLRRFGDALVIGFGLAPERELMLDLKMPGLSGD